MLPDGIVQQRQPRRENPQLFNLVVGGYGLFGVILDAELEVADNAVYQSERQVIDYQAFAERLAPARSPPDPSLGLMYGHLSTAPQSLLDEMILYTYRAGRRAGRRDPAARRGRAGQAAPPGLQPVQARADWRCG